MRLKLLAAAGALMVSGSANAAPIVTTGLLNQGTGQVQLGGGGRYISLTFSKPVQSVQGTVYWYADFGPTFCDAARTLECTHPLADANGRWNFRGENRTRYVVQVLQTLSGNGPDYYFDQAYLVSAGGFFNYINTNTGPVGYRITYANGVPEPATWAFLIIGFGAVGGALRQRKAIGAWRTRSPGCGVA